MKTKILFSSLLLSISMLSAQTVTLRVTNPNKSELKNAPIVVVLDKYKTILDKKRTELAVFVDGKQLSSQTDDLNKDGIVDELVFLIDLQAGQTHQVTLKTIPASQRENFPTEVYADLITKSKDGKMEFIKEIYRKITAS